MIESNRMLINKTLVLKPREPNGGSYKIIGGNWAKQKREVVVANGGGKTNLLRF